MEEATTCDSLHMPPQPPTYIPLDIIQETILCRLPVKSLLRFRCICNSWNSLISNDRKFAKKHLRLSPKRQHLVTTTWRMAKLLTIMSCPFHDSLSLHSTFNSKATQLDYSPIIPDSWDGLIASCDGLLCFVIDNRLASLYNPCTKKVKKLPSIDLPREEGSTLVAFGYDPFIDNYKVVAVFWYKYDFYFGRYKTQANVYSYTLGTNSWKRIKEFPFLLRFSGHGMSKHGRFVSGTVNWLAYHHSNGHAIVSSHTIVSLHLGKETYQEILQPDYGNSKMLTLEVMRDCLCLFSQESPKSSTDVWIMKEYGNKESWIKFSRLPCFGDFSYVFHTDIVYIFEDDNHVMVVFEENCKFKWVVYDFKNDTINSFKIQDNLGMVKSKVYVESLISP